MSVCRFEKSETGFDPTQAIILTVHDPAKIGEVFAQALQPKPHGPSLIPDRLRVTGEGAQLLVYLDKEGENLSIGHLAYG